MLLNTLTIQDNPHNKELLHPKSTSIEVEKRCTKIMSKYVLKKGGKRTPERMPTMKEKINRKSRQS